MTARKIQQIVPGMPASDGAGVKLVRSLGAAPRGLAPLRADPFLMLDAFSSDNPDDYIAGFPSHPHRGFETVTYLLDGHMLHEDHLGNRGDLEAGGVQWMTAGRGIIHSEMPQMTEGLLRGFQLWINLPAKEKMKPAGYRDIPRAEIPELAAPGATLKLIAGELTLAGATTTGPIHGLATAPLYVDVALEPGAAAAHYNRGNVLQDLGQFSAAVASLRRALELQPDFADAHLNLGHVLRELGQYEPAKASFRRALELQPEDLDARSNLLSTACLMAGQSPAQLLAEAREFGEQAARRGPPFAEWRNDPDPERRLRVGFV